MLKTGRDGMAPAAHSSHEFRQDADAASFTFDQPPTGAAGRLAAPSAVNRPPTISESSAHLARRIKSRHGLQRRCTHCAEMPRAYALADGCGLATEFRRTPQSSERRPPPDRPWRGKVCFGREAGASASERRRCFRRVIYSWRLSYHQAITRRGVFTP